MTFKIIDADNNDDNNNFIYVSIEFLQRDALLVRSTNEGASFGQCMG